MENNKCWFLAIANRRQDFRLFEFIVYFSKSKKAIYTALFSIFLTCSNYSFPQKPDSLKVAGHFGGAVTVTNNGISFIPTFSLGKPAIIFDLSMRKARLSFEPQFRFALNGKPWSFLFWWRYKLIKTSKVTLSLGAHPAFVFKTITVTTDGVSQQIITTQRYLAAELAPSYFLTKNISIGLYYLYSHGMEANSIKNTNFLTINSNLSHIRLSKQLFMKFIPQVYYLKMDAQDGFYFTSALTLAHRKIPLSISAIINKIIKTDIKASQNFVWNVSLIYSFNKKYQAI